MSEEEMEELLVSLIQGDIEPEDLEDMDEELLVNTFANEGIMTNNKGLVVRYGDSELQITIVKSR